MTAINYTITNIGNTSITSFTFEFVTPVQVELHADFSTIKSGESSDFTGTSYTISDLDLLPSSTASFSIDYTYLSGYGITYNGLVTVTGYNSTGEKVRTVTTEIIIVPANPSPMTLVYNTALSSTTEIQLPLSGAVNVLVDWGDGNTESFTTEGIKSHTYATNGTYTVSITGSLERFGDSSSIFGVTNATSLIACTSWGNLNLADLSWAFSGCSNLVSVPNYIPVSVTTLEYIFNGALIINDTNISLWDTTNVTNMRGVFCVAEQFNQPLSGWNISNVTNIKDIFNAAYAFNQNISNWDVSKITDMYSAFNGASSFNQPLNNWNVSSVTEMSYMFQNATVFNQDISNWCVTLIPSEPTNFSIGSPLTAPNKPIWGTCP